jgi:hypothetical protein
VKQAIAITIAASLLALTGCSSPEISKTATTPTPATPAPTATAAQSGDLQKAAEELEKSLGELQNKNYRGALDWLNSTQKEVTATLINLNAPASVKTSVELAQAELDKVKALIEKRDPTAEKSLTAAYTQISKLAERVQSLNIEATKEKADTGEKAVPKKQ